MSFSAQDPLRRGFKLLTCAAAVFSQLWSGDDMTYLTGFVRLGVDEVENLHSQAGESINSEATLPEFKSWLSISSCVTSSMSL